MYVRASVLYMLGRSVSLLLVYELCLCAYGLTAPYATPCSGGHMTPTNGMGQVVDQ